MQIPNGAWRLAALLTFLSGPAVADRFIYEPASDSDDAQFIDGFFWDARPNESTIADLMLNLGQEGASTYDVALGYHVPDIVEGQSVADVRLHLNEQGSVITNGLIVEIRAAKDLDPLSVSGAGRFALPRTTAKVFWNISAEWDSSGQRIAKYAETPDLSPILNEVFAQPGWDTGPRDVLLFLASTSIGDNVVRFDDTHGPYWNAGNAGIRPVRLRVSETWRDAFWGREILCRPKPISVAVNIVPHEATDAFVEWGTDGITFPNTTTTASLARGAGHLFPLSGLTPDTRYFYRLNVRPAGAGPFEVGPVRTFTTVPLPGQQTRICVTTDIHVSNQLALGLDTQMDLLETTLSYMPDFLLPDRYHFWMDLGDLVVIRAQRISFDQEEVEQRYRTAREYIDQAAHSLPLVFIRGNHEEVNGWDADSTGSNTAIWSGGMLLKYFSPPVPDEFYSGNTEVFPNLGIPGNYFAFSAGSLRIRALDPYLFSATRPHNGHGEVGGSLNGWDWTVGPEQYAWLQQDLVDHPAPYSLVALHHLTSAYTGTYYGRGGIEIVDWAVAGRPTFEWGGQDSTGVNVLASLRPTFDMGSPHDMLVNLGNQVVLKGHEHFHGRQSLDGMIYLTMAKPDDTGQHTGDLWGWRWVTFYPEASTLLESNSGFYSIVVDPGASGGATYSFVQTYPSAGLGTIRDTFTVFPPVGLDVHEPWMEAPRKTWIQAVRPNPAAAGAPVLIEWELGRGGPIRMAIIDAGGRLVRDLDLQMEGREPGPKLTRWDGRDRYGRRVASGVYFAALISGERRLDALKVVVLR